MSNTILRQVVCDDAKQQTTGMVLIRVAILWKYKWLSRSECSFETIEGYLT
jgi:hypothetical protein